MRRIGRPLPVAATGMLAGAAVCAALGLAACGSAVAGSGGHGGSGGTGGSGSNGAAAPAAAGGVCGNRASLDKVVITRTPGRMTSYMRDFTPLAELVTKGRAVRGLAASLCGLPPMRPGTMSCPIAFGGTLRFVFASPAQAFKPVVMESSGCRTVTGLGKVRSWARAPGAWQAVHTAITSGRLLLPLKVHGTTHS